MKKKILSLALLLLAIPALLHAEQSYLEVTAQGNKPVGLAVAPPASMGTSPDAKIAAAIDEVLRFDLNLVGTFSIFPGSATAATGGIRPGEFDFSPWRSLGAVYLVKAGYTVSGDKLTAEFRLYDVPQGRVVTAKRYTGTHKDVRWMAHAFCDQILLTLTREKGPFTGKIVFVTKASGNKEISVMDYDGHNVQRITKNGSINLNPDTSPDGHQIIFTSYKKRNPDLYRSTFSGAEARISHHRGINFTGAWSPDGKKIALAMSKDGNTELYLINRDGKQLARLTDNNDIDISPSWSPDGSRIAFVSDRLGSPQIFVMNADGSNVQKVTRNGGYNVTPAWSPKGDRILYSRQQGGFQIHSVNPDGTDDTQLTSDGRNENPRWSPDGRFITFSSNRSGKEAIYVMRADGTGQTKVSRDNGGASQPVWSRR